MKTFVLKSFFGLALIMAGVFGAQANTNLNSAEALSLVASSGCVGECGTSSSISYTVPGPTGRNNQLLLFKDNSNLCPNTGALAFIRVNGVFVAAIDLSTSNGQMFTARGGDVVTVSVTTFNKNNGISCKRLGNLNFSINYLYPILY